ncbi:MAG TPA: hypothetical protein V6D47_11495 [Oscillatoriaceae cyanobacterium]
MRRLLAAFLLTLGLAAPALAAPVPDNAPADTPVAKAFYASPLCQRLKALGLSIVAVTPLVGNEAVVAYYVPFQGAMSDWDDETRLVLYRWKGGTDFAREQFITKAGDSIHGHLSGLEIRDLDGDGQPEIIAAGMPGTKLGEVSTMIFRRDSATDAFQRIWDRHDLGAAVRANGAQLFYSYQMWDPARTRQYRYFKLAQGQYQPAGGK